MCALNMPEVFEMKLSRAIVKKGSMKEKVDKDKVQRLAKTCPVSAITIEGNDEK